MKKQRSWPAHIRIMWFDRVLFAAGLATLMFLASMFLGACVTTQDGTRRPPTPTELAAMDEPQWQGYLRRVEAWAAAAGYTAVEQGADVDGVLEFAQLLSDVTDPAQLTLAPLAERAGLSGPVAALLALEAQALLDARGGLPSGDRGKEFLHRAATAFVAGAAQASMARNHAPKEATQ